MKAEAGRRSSIRGGRVLRGRLLARVSLGVTVPLLAALVLVGPGVGSGIVLAQATGSPSPTPTGAGAPKIAFLNPAASYDPQTPKPPRPPADPTDPTGTPSPDRPKISDRFDGIDRAYHITAWVANVPANPIVEAYILPGAANSVEQTISLMDRVPGTDTWEYFWDIPDGFPEGNATMFVRLYTQTQAGIEQVAEHEVLVEVQHRGEAPTNPPDRPAEETVEITWPSNGGPLGFFKPKGGQWRTVVDGFTSSNTENFDVLYTTTDPGEEPEYVICAQDVGLYNTPEYEAGGGPPPAGVEIPFSAPCTLGAGDDALDVTGVAIVPLETDLPERNESTTGRNEQTQESADAHSVDPYVQDPSSMKISVDPQNTPQHSSIRRRTAGASTGAGGGCLAFLATVTDELSRPVQGANVDIHLIGPSDQVFFGDENANAGGGTSGAYAAPDKGSHQQELGKDCDSTGNPMALQGNQGEHNTPGGNDIKHRESTTGTGVGSGDQPGQGGVPPLVGQWRFHLHSPVPGITEIVAWVDNESPPDAATAPAADDDLLEPTEPSTRTFAQWYSAAPVLDIVPAGGSALVGSCARYLVKVRSGAAPVSDINVDVHAQGPNDDLDFCDPTDASANRAPERGPAPTASPHEAEDPGESSHAQASPRAQHTEGETDPQGNFVFGITSLVSGDTTITAWIDGEKSFYDNTQNTRKSSDNDILGSETSRIVGHSWTASAADATVRFVNPSSYGGSTIISRKQDADSTYHLVARSDGAGLISGVEFLYSSSASGPFTSIGQATRAGESDAYELAWTIPAALANGSYTLRAQIIGTNKLEDRAVTLTGDAENAEITRPANAAAAPFSRGATTVAGLASAGAEKVRIYYAKAAANSVHNTAAWTLCGTQTLDGGGTSSQSFSTACTLVTPDQPSQVTSIAAVSVDCSAEFGCTGDTPAGSEAVESGDAHRVFAFDSNPIVSIEPAEAEAKVGGCHRFELRLSDQTGQPIPNQNVDLHLMGPNDSAAFCDPGDGSPRTNPGDGSHAASSEDPQTGFHEDPAGADTKHTEGTSGSAGRFIFGITSPDEGDSQITAWADQTENDLIDPNENRDAATMHWVADEVPSDKCTIRGTSGDDVLEGTSDRDVICGRGGNDMISALAGDDLLRGGFGADTLRGGSGDDFIRGRQDADRLFGAAGFDTLQGGRGKDRLDGGPDTDDCVGGPGRDRVTRCE